MRFYSAGEGESLGCGCPQAIREQNLQSQILIDEHNLNAPLGPGFFGDGPEVTNTVRTFATQAVAVFSAGSFHVDVAEGINGTA